MKLTSPDTKLRKSKYQMKCPICDSELKVTQDRMEGILLEETLDCPKGDYHSYYGFGSTWLSIGGKSFWGSYNDDMTKAKILDAEVSAQIEHARKMDRAKRTAWTIVAVLLIPGGTILIPLYLWFKKKKAQSNKP
jgi:hypothetical protein